METRPNSRRHSKAYGAGDLASVAKGPEMQNRLYAFRALERLNLLGDDELKQTLADRPALRWLLDEEGARWPILTELGRIRDTGQFDSAVRWVLAHRPRTGEAVSRLRQFRTCRTEAADARQLARNIIRTVNAYGHRHPYLTHEQKLEALRLAADEAADARQLATDPGGCSATTTAVNRP